MLSEGVEITEHEIDVRFRGKSVPDGVRLAKEILSELPSWKIKSAKAQESGKPEAWYVVDAQPGAGIYVGLRAHSHIEAVRAALAEAADQCASR